MSEIITSETLGYLQSPIMRNVASLAVETGNPKKSPVRHMERFFGTFGVSAANYEILRSNNDRQLVRQQYSIIDSARVTHFQPKQSIKGFLLTGKPFEVKSTFTADDLIKKWRIVGGQKKALSGVESINLRLNEIGENITLSEELRAFFALKFGYDLDMIGLESTPEVYAAFDGVNFLDAWGEARPTGATYPITEGQSVSFTAAGDLYKFTKNAQKTMKLRGLNSQQPIAVKSGAIVLCGPEYFEAVVNSPDYKDQLKNANTAYATDFLQKTMLIDINSTPDEQVKSIQYNGVIFITMPWEFIINRKVLTIMGAKEQLILPIIDYSIVDRVNFLTASVSSSSAEGAPGFISWSKIADNQSHVELGIRGNTGVCNKYPEVAILGKLA